MNLSKSVPSTELVLSFNNDFFHFRKPSKFQAFLTPTIPRKNAKNPAESTKKCHRLVDGDGRLTIPTADGDLLHYSAVASEPLESASKAPAAEVAASSCLRRAAALAGLGLELWG